MLSFFEETFHFGFGTGGPRAITRDINISRSNPSDNAKIIFVLKEFDISFGDGDHPFKKLEIKPDLRGFGPGRNSAKVMVTMGLRDSSNFYDDAYFGNVKLGVIVVDDNRVRVFDRNQDFGSVRGAGPQTITDYYQQNDPNYESVALLSGFEISYSDEQENVEELWIDVDGQTLPYRGTMYDAVQCTLGLHDDSNFYDDPYEGTVHFSILSLPKDQVVVQSGEIAVAGHESGPSRRTAEIPINTILTDNSFFLGMTGFKLRFENGDHHFGRAVSKISVENFRREAGRTTVFVNHAGGIRDFSGYWNDEYASQVKYTLLAILPSARLEVQNNWRWCRKCEGLFYGRNHPNESGVCPAGGRHDSGGSGHYSTVHNEPIDPSRQGYWRHCHKCEGHFYGRNHPNNSGVCPAGGGHDSTRSGFYSLFHNQPVDPNRQDGWRWCRKCEGLFYGRNHSNESGVCPAGGSHDSSGSGHYSIIHN